MFSLHVLDYIILTYELLTTVRELVVLLFHIVVILRTCVLVPSPGYFIPEYSKGGYIVFVCSLSSVSIHSSV